jgi:Uncharacterised nucleotidyltransferase
LRIHAVSPIAKKKATPLVPEFEFLCLMLRSKPEIERARRLQESGLDWTAIRTFAESNSVRPRLLAALRTTDFGADADRLGIDLETFQRTHALRRMNYAAELIETMEILTARRIEFATFKGVSLAVQLYDDIAGREFNDIDIIVRPRDMDAATDAMMARGYVPRVADKAYREAFLAYQQQYLFEHPQSHLIIDLHWGFVTKGVPFPIEPEEIWNNLANLNLAGRKIPTLCNEDLALFLAGHGTKESWRDLGWVLDFALLADTGAGIDWANVYRRAERHRCGRAILLGVLLTSTLFGARWDGHLLELAQADATAQKMAAAIVSRLQHQSHREYSEAMLANLDLCENWWQRARVLADLMTTRTTGDYEFLPLTPALWPAYHAFRPFRLALVACGWGGRRHT